MKTLSIEHAADDEPDHVSLYVDGRRALSNFTRQDAESVASVLEARHEALYAAVHAVLKERFAGLDLDGIIADKVTPDVVAAVEQLPGA